LHHTKIRTALRDFDLAIAQGMGAPHNDQAVNSQLLGFLSRRCDVYWGI